jgi:AraC-like DNA-binding protein
MPDTTYRNMDNFDFPLYFLGEGQTKGMNADFLSFITGLLEKESIHYTVLKEPFENLREVDCRFRAIFDRTRGYESFLAFLENHCGPDTILQFSDKFKTIYTAVALPADNRQRSFLVIGPFLDHHLSEQETDLLCHDLEIAPVFCKSMREYYYATPLLDSRSLYRILMQVAVFGLFGTDRFVFKETEMEATPVATAGRTIAPTETFPMERDGQKEDLLLSAIGKGDADKAGTYLEDYVSEFPQAKDHGLPRESKNRAIAFNALVKKTLEQEEVHPFYTESNAQTFDRLIEQATTVPALRSVLIDLTEASCALVRDHSLKKYPAVLKNVITYAEFNFPEPLSLRDLAHRYSINPSYLSMLFRKHLGITMTEFINALRLDHAKGLLKNTALPIKEIAKASGFEDVNYFTRVFKKTEGTTPRDFRKTSRTDTPANS